MAFVIGAGIAWTLAAAMVGLARWMQADASRQELPTGIDGCLADPAVPDPYGTPWLRGWVQIGQRVMTQANNRGFEQAYEDVWGSAELTVNTLEGARTIRLDAP
jgi:hypothetical protein